MEFNYLDGSLKSYIERLSEKSPCPGGGSASVFSGVLACGLVCMVSNYTVGSKLVAEESRCIVEDILKKAKELESTMAFFVEKDSYIYEKIRNAFKLMSKDASASILLENALKESTGLHLQIMNDCYKIAQWNQILVKHCNPNLISDVAVSASLVLGSIKAGRINIFINLKELKDKKFVKDCMEKTESVYRSIEKTTTDIIETIDKNLRETINGG